MISTGGILWPTHCLTAFNTVTLFYCLSVRCFYIELLYQIEGLELRVLTKWEKINWRPLTIVGLCLELYSCPWLGKVDWDSPLMLLLLTLANVMALSWSGWRSRPSFKETKCSCKCELHWSDHGIYFLCRALGLHIYSLSFFLVLLYK